MKHRGLFTVLCTALLATSCKSEPSYLGVYAFQMGKDSGSHLALALELKDEDYVVEEEVRGKKLTITANTSMMESEGAPEDIVIDGGYTIGDEYEKGHFLNLEFSIIDDLDTLIKILLDVGDVTPGDYSSYLQLLVTTYVDSKSFYFTIPVSFDDLYLQLYWYGYDVHNDEGKFIEVTKHDLGTHPTAEEIAEIDAVYYGHHKDFDGYQDLHFRDYHTVTIGLSKKTTK